ncbi:MULTISPECIES: arabinosyltransferase domain-containing protein [unclassified Corynebacterium]|uniref:arabinosyltransferase domain-containing protein n=2 Tax=unclassified Corynebacterium TaxID=2624378 RepID=UPI002107CEE2|nr:arabinosyltransferase domain-containing protein [Corynebacterium sp. SY003]
MLTSLVTGLLGMMLFILTPFLPVNQVQSSLSWPQNSSLSSINAPLESYAPEKMDVTVPISAIGDLRENQQLVLGTLPLDSKKATSRGLFIRSAEGGIDVIVREKVIINLSAQQVQQLPADAKLVIHSGEKETTVAIPGAFDEKGKEYAATIEEDSRPQITGIYTELDDTRPDAAQALIANGLSVNVEINSRFTSSPSLLKFSAMALGVVLTIISLITLFRIDRHDGRGRIHSLTAKSWRPTFLDAIVGALLTFWYFFGANTSDDGFIITMAKASHSSGYMANYYRWFGAPESPFGAPYYDLIALMSQFNTASTWLRLPAFIAALGMWFLISRMILPTLGEKISGRRVAQWTAAFMFLAFYMAYDNGLRPEPIIAFGALSTWVLFERAIATDRLLPAALGTATAAFTLACGPTGLMAVAALLACLSGVLGIIYRRTSSLARTETKVARGGAWLALLAPFFAAGFSVLVAVFSDQTLMSVLESIRVRSEKGPSLSWYQEYFRYTTLMQTTVDGSFARRFAFLFLMVSLVLVIVSVLRNRKIPGTNHGSVIRLILVLLFTFFFLIFTPTKWTHHFGIFAGFGGVIGGLAAVALSQFALQAKRTRTLITGIILLVFAFALSATNGWWYVSSYGIPWFDKTIQVNHIEAGTVMLVISVIVIFIGALQSYSKDLHTTIVQEEGGAAAVAKEEARNRFKAARFAGIASAPIAVACIISVLFSCASFAKGFAAQYPAYSVGLGNLRTLKGQTCAMADNILVETNSNDSFLPVLDGSELGASLENEENRGFGPNNIPTQVEEDSPTATVESLAKPVPASENTEETETSEETPLDGSGVNGSFAILPFDLDPSRVPVTGSFSLDSQTYSEAFTNWYSLPQAKEQAPLVVVSVAGRIQSTDINGVLQNGQSLVVQYGKSNPDGSVTELGETTMLDPLAHTSIWRNLRLPLADLPADANVIRLHAIDSSLDPKQWLAFTPPRVPTLDTLNNVVGTAPTLIDWSTAFQFPCQRPFGHYAGVAEIPEYRILPDYDVESDVTYFQDYYGGGIMGTAEAVNYSYLMPSYAKDDWLRDWGSIEVLKQRPNSLGQAPQLAKIDTEVITRSGLWKPSTMSTNTENN